MRYSTLYGSTFVLFFASAFIAAGIIFLPANAASADQTPATIIIEQRSAISSLGEWTLLNVIQNTFSGSTATATLENLPQSTYTLFAKPPKGLSTLIVMHENGEMKQTTEEPQITFPYSGQAYRFTITYTLVNTGRVGVTSTPGGIPFELRGPNNSTYRGITPASFDIMPIGLYSVRYLPDGCPAMPERSNQLTKNGRVDFGITIQCDSLKPIEDQMQIDIQFVSAQIDGTTVVFKDVPREAWFASYVAGVLRSGIIGGYKDERGYSTGRFGPQNAVTLAELAKIGHELGALDLEGSLRAPKNRSVPPWASKYVASAEAKDWVIFTDEKVDVNRPATRGEVIVTLMQVLDIPLRWPKGKMFTDVTPRTQYSAAIETAAEDGIITGLTDRNGIFTGSFGPDKPINRAELSKIIVLALGRYSYKFSSSSSSSSISR